MSTLKQFVVFRWLSSIMAEHKISVRPCRDPGLVRCLGMRHEFTCSCGLRQWYIIKAECVNAADYHEQTGEVPVKL